MDTREFLLNLCDTKSPQYAEAVRNGANALVYCRIFNKLADSEHLVKGLSETVSSLVFYASGVNGAEEVEQLTRDIDQVIDLSQAEADKVVSLFFSKVLGGTQ